MLDFFLQIFRFLASNLLLIVTVTIFLSYVILGIVSAVTLRRYLRKNSYIDYNQLMLSPFVPKLSVIVPAYNESRSSIDNIAALLSLYYRDFDVIFVNDGSKDGTLEKVIEAYDLEKVNYAFDYRLPSERIRAIYKSKKHVHRRLTVIDKINGGKADALNAGINVSRSDLIVCVDADSIMEPDALLKLVKPFLEETDKKVIATGGVIRIANSCDIEDGQIKQINLPKDFFARIQVLEYTRAFLMARMAWSKLDGLLLISGALGMFDREVVIRAGGYDINSVGEDMELVVRMRRYMVENKMPYIVTYIPDPLCWTEVPTRIKIHQSQRNRWTRGTMETLFKHIKVFFNPKYGKFGMWGYPYWFFYEWLAPLLEFFGLVYFTILAFLGWVNWSFFFLLLAFVYTFAVSLSIWAVLFEERTYHKYNSRKDVLKLVGTAFLEPLFYHPLTVIWAIRANIEYLFGKRGWGKMEHMGFGKEK